MRRGSPEIKGQGFILRVTPTQDADVILRILTTTGEKIVTVQGAMGRVYAQRALADGSARPLSPTPARKAGPC
jgi:recombinational DNA repair protein (RecF pathway)